ncbi:hypothetical protein E4U55_001449 [Claviceps digitariae]|nr:hypothetical protein E4U55_001449 [Claviceps digitariae]
MADASATAPATSNVSIQPEPLVEDEDNVEATAGSITVKWDVKGGKDRTHKPYLNTNYYLDGSPNIQGITITSNSAVKVLCFGGNPDDTPDLELHGPTDGKNKITPVRLGSYRVESR